MILRHENTANTMTSLSALNIAHLVYIGVGVLYWLVLAFVLSYRIRRDKASLTTVNSPFLKIPLVGAFLLAPITILYTSIAAKLPRTEFCRITSPLFSIGYMFSLTFLVNRLIIVFQYVTLTRLFKSLNQHKQHKGLQYSNFHRALSYFIVFRQLCPFLLLLQFFISKQKHGSVLHLANTTVLFRCFISGHHVLRWFWQQSLLKPTSSSSCDKSVIASRRGQVILSLWLSFSHWVTSSFQAHV